VSNFGPRKSQIGAEVWVFLQKEMIAYYVDPLEEDRAWNSLDKLQQTGAVKDYSEKFLQLIVKVGKNVTEKDKIRRYVEGLKDEVRTVIRVGMVDGRYTIFPQGIDVYIYMLAEIRLGVRPSEELGVTRGVRVSVFSRRKEHLHHEACNVMRYVMKEQKFKVRAGFCCKNNCIIFFMK
jgi:Retrotransposon gag protein